MPKLIVQTDKTLKLSNAVSFAITIEENADVEMSVTRLDNYIKSKGLQALGPLIQKTEMFLTESGELDINLVMIRQATNYIIHCEPPFSCDSILRVKNCLFLKFVGEESKIKYAYDKLNLYAYEEDIELFGTSYTIFVDRQDDIVTADIFMPQKQA